MWTREIAWIQEATLSRKQATSERVKVTRERENVGVCAIRAVGSGGSRRLTWEAQYLRAVQRIVLSVGDGYMAGVVGLYTRWGAWRK